MNINFVTLINFLFIIIMMYSKTLIILTLLLAVALIYLVYDCKCDRENFQNETSAVTTVNTIPK